MPRAETRLAVADAVDRRSAQETARAVRAAPVTRSGFRAAGARRRGGRSHIPGTRVRVRRGRCRTEPAQIPTVVLSSAFSAPSSAALANQRCQEPRQVALRGAARIRFAPGGGLGELAGEVQRRVRAELGLPERRRAQPADPLEPGRAIQDLRDRLRDLKTRRGGGATRRPAARSRLAPESSGAGGVRRSLPSDLIPLIRSDPRAREAECSRELWSAPESSGIRAWAGSNAGRIEGVG